MSVSRTAWLSFSVAFAFLLLGLALGRLVWGRSDVKASHGFCDVLEQLGRNDVYPVKVTNQQFVASVEETGPSAISFPPCGRAIPLSKTDERIFNPFYKKALTKHNVVFAGGRVTGAIIWLNSVSVPAFEAKAVKNPQEATMPRRL